MRQRALALTALALLSTATSGLAHSAGMGPRDARAIAGATSDAISGVTAASRLRSVVIDTDMGGDDWMAILYLLKRPDVHVRAITVAGTGVAHCAPGVRNALGLLALIGAKSVPVACGRETPMRGQRAFPTQWRRAADTLLGLALPKGAAVPTRSAVEVLSSVVRSAPGEVSLVALGPLTNVAEALLHEPTLVRKLEGIYIMGGAVAVSGNVPGSAAEWNFYVDPHAADIVLGARAPVTLVPLDATNDVPVTDAFYDRIKAAHRTPEATFVHDLLTAQRDVIASGEYYFWDPLTAAVLTDPTLVTIARQRIRVTLRGPRSGTTRIAEAGTNVRVAVSARRPRFERVFLSALNAPRRAP